MKRILPSKEQFNKWTLPTKIGYVGFWISLVGIPALLITYFTFAKDWINRKPEILNVKPIVYVDECKDIQNQGFPVSKCLGIFFIIHIKNGSNVSTLNGLKIKAKKYYIDLSEYLTLHRNIGKSTFEIKKEWTERKPFYSFDFDAYLAEKNLKTILFPYDEAYIGFVLLDPIINGQSESGWGDSRENFVGYEYDSVFPNQVRTYPEFRIIFKDFNLKNLPPKKIRHEFEFYLIVNNQEIVINQGLFRATDMVNNDEYENDSFERMFLRY